MDVESTMLPLGTKMPNFNLLGIDGDMYTNEIFDDIIFPSRQMSVDIEWQTIH